MISVLEADEVSVRRLVVNVAYHSPYMDAIASDYARSIEALEEGRPFSKCITMISSVTGRRTSLEELRTPEYWVSSMVSPVRFSDALQQLCVQSVQEIRKKLDRSHLQRLQMNILVEIGPHSALQGPIREDLGTVKGGDKIDYSSILIRFQPALQSVLNTIGRLHCQGYPVDLESATNWIQIRQKPPQCFQPCPNIHLIIPELIGTKVGSARTTVSLNRAGWTFWENQSQIGMILNLNGDTSYTYPRCRGLRIICSRGLSFIQQLECS